MARMGGAGLFKAAACCITLVRLHGKSAIALKRDLRSERISVRGGFARLRDKKCRFFANGGCSPPAGLPLSRSELPNGSVPQCRAWTFWWKARPEGEAERQAGCEWGCVPGRRATVSPASECQIWALLLLSYAMQKGMGGGNVLHPPCLKPALQSSRAEQGVSCLSGVGKWASLATALRSEQSLRPALCSGSWALSGSWILLQLPARNDCHPAVAPHRCHTPSLNCTPDVDQIAHPKQITELLLAFWF